MRRWGRRTRRGRHAITRNRIVWETVAMAGLVCVQVSVLVHTPGELRFREPRLRAGCAVAMADARLTLEALSAAQEAFGAPLFAAEPLLAAFAVGLRSELARRWGEIPLANAPAYR